MCNFNYITPTCTYQKKRKYNTFTNNNNNNNDMAIILAIYIVLRTLCLTETLL